MLADVSRNFVGWTTRTVTTLKERNKGGWHWMQTKSVPLASLNRSLWRSAESSSNYYLLLFLSGTIATLGLLANSSATVIGAMIVAPLMGPIEGMSFAMVMANRRLLKRASLSLILGSLLTIATAAIISNAAGIDSLTAEILARTKPTLLDLGVAIAAGATGALAKSRRGISDALPGVAIAVALVPPLSVIGIGIAFASRQVFWGATLLYLTNLVGIIFSGGVVFLTQRYGSIERAKRGMTIAITTLLCLGIPLSLSFQDLTIKKQANISVNKIVRNSNTAFAQANVRSVSIQREKGRVNVHLDVEAVPTTITEAQVDSVRMMLSDTLKQPVSLSVDVIPIEQFSSEEPSSEDSASFLPKLVGGF